MPPWHRILSDSDVMLMFATDKTDFYMDGAVGARKRHDKPHQYNSSSVVVGVDLVLSITLLPLLEPTELCKRVLSPATRVSPGPLGLDVAVKAAGAVAPVPTQEVRMGERRGGKGGGGGAVEIGRILEGFIWR